MGDCVFFKEGDFYIMELDIDYDVVLILGVFSVINEEENC